MEKRVRIFVVCALGTAAGLAVAMVVPQIVWWLGALVGGAVSGFLYALPEIVRYTPEAARIAWRTLHYIPRIWQRIASLPRTLVAHRWRIAFLPMAVISVVLLGWGVLTVDISEAGETINTLAILPLLYLIIYAFAIIVGSIAFMVASGDIEPETTLEEDKTTVKKYILFVSPIGPLLGLVLGLIYLIIGVGPPIVGAVKEACSFIAKYSKTLFILIHSRELVLCTVDGALGVLISYGLCVTVLNMQFGPTLLAGGLIGGLLGILNYELISKKVLHLALNEKP